MTTIANCFDLNQAMELKLLLERAGIDSFIPDEISAAIAPYQFFTPTGVRLQVSDENAAEARQLVKDAQSSEAPGDGEHS